MVKFRLQSARTEFTGFLPSRQAGWEFKDGVASVPDVDADAAESILCRYYAAIREEEEEMSVAIYGPTDKQWRDKARGLGRQRFPGHAMVLRDSTEFNDGDLDTSVAVFCVNDSAAGHIAGAADGRKIPFTLLAAPGEEAGGEEEDSDSADEGEDSDSTSVRPNMERTDDEQQQEYVRSVIDLTVKDILLLLKEEPSIRDNQEMVRAMHSAECDTPAPRRTVLAALEEKMEKS